MGCMAPHPECLCEKHDWTTATAGNIGRELRCGVNIEDIVARTGKSSNAVCLCPGGKWTYLMLLKCGSESDLVILQDVDGRNMENGRHVHAFMEGRGFRRSVSNPC